MSGSIHRRAEDVTGWIAYADFLTTLAVLFFLLAIVYNAQRPIAEPGYLVGRFRAQAGTIAPVACRLRLGERPEGIVRTREAFQVQVDSVPGHIGLLFAARCTGFRDYETLVQIRARDTTRLIVELSLDQDSNVARIDAVAGDALFNSNEASLRSGGAEVVRSLGRRIRDNLRPGEIVLVQGHTDDVPFRSAGNGRDNWVLSGDRAAAAARVLTEDVGLPPCRVATMGFGPSRPVSRILPTDSRDTVRAKRSRNRRIEFRRVRGSELASGECP